MKLNIGCPATANAKSIEIDDDKLLLPFLEKRIGQEVAGDSLGPDYAGYVFRITGGNDKQGFPMMQGILSNHRVRLMFRKEMPCFRERRSGQMKRKSIRGCIVGTDIAALALIVVKKGPKDIAGLTDAESTQPRRLGPKRAGKIRKMFGLNKEDDVSKFVVRREVKPDVFRSPKVQRLMTPRSIQKREKGIKLYKAHRLQMQHDREEYKKVLADYVTKRKTERVDEKLALVESKKKRHEQLKARRGKAAATASQKVEAMGKLAA